MDWPFPLPSYSYSKISINTGVNSKFYGIRVAKKLVYNSLSPYNSLWGPSLHFRVLLEITLLSLPICGTGGYCSPPPKPPFPLSSFTKDLILRDCHDKRLRFSVFSCDCFSLDFLLFCFSQLFWSKWPFFVFLRSTRSLIEILKNWNFQNISTLLSSTFLLLRSFLSNSCFVGRLRCANLAEWHTVRLYKWNQLIKQIESYTATAIPHKID